MENLYKNLYSLYQYWKKIGFQFILTMGFLGFKFAFFISQQSAFQSVYKFLFVKRPRDSTDILVEPLEKHQWICETTMHFEKKHRKSMFFFKKDVEHVQTFYLKEEYFFPPFSTTPPFEMSEKNKKKTENQDGNKLVTYSYPITNENNVEKSLRMIRSQDFLVDEQTTVPVLSSLSFIDIQYIHPEMKTPVILEIPKEWCCVGNELFTPVFVIRMLYYQTLPFVFDLRYTLDIMDNELNMFTLDCGHHIIVRDKGYQMISA